MAGSARCCAREVILDCAKVGIATRAMYHKLNSDVIFTRMGALITHTWLVGIGASSA